MEQFAVTDRAAARIAEIVAETNQATETALRVAVPVGWGAAVSSTASSWIGRPSRTTW